MIFHYRTASGWITHFALVVLSIGMTSLVHAAALDVNLSDDTAEFRFITPVGYEDDTQPYNRQRKQRNTFGGAELDLGFLSTSTDDVIAMIGFQAVDAAGSATPGLKVGVGVKAFAGTIDSHDVYAATLGGNARFLIFNRVAIFGDLHYAPNVVTFGDASRLLYFNAHLEYEILPQAVVYIGYRKLRANLDAGGHISIDNGAHVGLQFLF